MATVQPYYRVTTVTSPPFVMYNETTRAWSGLCIDLLNELRTMINFKYDIRETEDKEHGQMTGSGIWSGMVGDLVKNVSDVAISTLWIDAHRAQAVDFTMPFHENSGITIITEKHDKELPFNRFLVIVEIEVWFSFVGAFLLTGITTYCFERWSPFSYRNNKERYKDEVDERFCSFRECLWFTMTAITPHGCGETPKNFSGKLASATWWLFGFVIIAAYTANLAAHQTLDRMVKQVETIEDLRSQYYIEYSMIGNSPTHRYFETMVGAEDILYHAWRKMSLDESKSDWERAKLTVWEYPLEEKFTKMFYTMQDSGFSPDVESAAERLRLKPNATRAFALVTETTVARYLMLTQCRLRQIGQEFARRPFAIAVQKGSPLKDQINQALEKLTREGKLELLKKKWWDNNPAKVKCPRPKLYNDGMGLDTMTSIFLIIPFGIVVCFVVLCLQYAWYYRRMRVRKPNL